MTKITAGIAAAIAAAAIGISVPATSLASTGDSAGGRTTAAAQQSSPAKAPKPAAFSKIDYLNSKLGSLNLPK